MDYYLRVLSIIVPTLNEQDTLATTLRRVNSASDDVEIIVSDCGSRDDTVGVARTRGARIVEGSCSRAQALNRGAGAARGEVLFFLHADSIPPIGFAKLIQNAMSNSGIVGGTFDFDFAPDPTETTLDRQCLDFVILFNRIRFRWTRNFYGDQGLFLRRECFERLGGYPRVRLMEDARFARKLNNLGKTIILRPPMRTSPRRFVHHGVVRQFAHDLLLIACELCEFHPAPLWNGYHRINHGAGCKAMPRSDQTLKRKWTMSPSWTT